MPPTDMDALSIAQGYLRCSAELSREPQDPDGIWDPAANPDQRAYDLVKDAIREGPPAHAWRLVSAVLREAPEDRLGHEAAGPLEDLVRRWGAELVDVIEAEAARDARFRWALGGIWLRRADLPAEVITRLVAASDGAIRPY